MSAIETVQQIYAAFGRGDIESILRQLHEDVEWEYGAHPNPLPWLQTLQGRREVPRFFEALAAIELDTFRPTRFFGDERTVVVLLDESFTVRKTGRRVVEVDAVHVWHLDEAGRVVRMRHRVDTLEAARAMDGA